MFTSEKSSFEFFKAYSGVYGKSTALVTFLLILHFYLFDKNLLPAFLGFLLVFLNPYSRFQFYQNHHSNFLKKKSSTSLYFIHLLVSQFFVARRRIYFFLKQCLKCFSEFIPIHSKHVLLQNYHLSLLVLSFIFLGCKSIGNNIISTQSQPNLKKFSVSNSQNAVQKSLTNELKYLFFICSNNFIHFSFF